MWSHHEKIVVIDQNIAFLGGLDLCLGRWDTNEHHLKDLKDKNGKCFLPGLDYSNSRVKDFSAVSKYKVELIDRNTQPRMPWHDVHCVIYGESAKDLARHFIEYWNHAKIDYEGTRKKQEGTFLKPMGTMSDSDFRKLSSNMSDSSDEDAPLGKSNVKSQGILGKGIEIVEEEDEKLNEEDDLYMLKSKDKEENRKSDTINEVDEEQEGQSNQSSSMDGSDDEFSDEEDKEDEKNEVEEEKKDIVEDFITDEDAPQFSPVIAKQSSQPYRPKGNSIMNNIGKTRPKAQTVLSKNSSGRHGVQRNSAIGSISIPLLAKEVIEMNWNTRRNSITIKQEHFFEDFNIDEFHCEGNNDLVEKMKEFVNAEYLKRSKRFGRLRIKKIWKKVRGKELNEEKEKDQLRKKFILEHLTDEQRKLFSEELMEANIDDEDDTENNPKFEIVPRMDATNKGTCKCQVLRSCDNWSTGVKSAECSIFNAYIDCITNAKKFIYIENQFFISNPNKGGIVKNSIAKAIFDRIVVAHENKEQFKVIVFIPLLPGFEGDVTKSDSAVLKTQIKYQQETISKGKNSLCELLIEAKIKPEDYIRFYGLRQHDLFNNVPKHEIIYIHSKMMIVDDRKVIIGSANINDRSMLGTRDSEIAILIEDEDVIQSRMGGSKFMVGKMPHQLRMEIYQEHFGAKDISEVEDPLDSKFFKEFVKRAKRNTEIYKEIFNAEPDNSQISVNELKKQRKEFASLSNETLLSKYNELIGEVKGHYVEYPLEFLKETSLSLKLLDKEKLVPAINFV